MPHLLADCHLHFEGCLPEETLRALAGRAGHRYADAARFSEERSRLAGAGAFLETYAEICRLFRSPEDYGEAARAIARGLADDGLAYAEIYVSPEIFSKCDLPADECLAAISDAFESAAAGGTRCRILLDAVRHWGEESAERVLDLYESRPVPGIVGFGLGGDEASLPASAFAGVYARARALGLRTSVHAGEWAGPESVRDALDALRPDRVDHGIAAAADPHLMERLVEEGTVLCVALSSNVATAAVPSLAEHPLRRLLAAGVPVALSADDPLLFGTTTRREYAIARDSLGCSEEDLRRCAEAAWRAAFAPAADRHAGRSAVERATISELI